MQKLCDIDPATTDKLPPQTTDKSGIGVHYVDAFLKQMNGKLDDGTRVMAKRRGLSVNIRIGQNKGSGLMRRIDVSNDPIVMLEAALKEAATEAGAEIAVKEGAVFVTPPAE
jgi:hypothetical protein